MKSETRYICELCGQEFKEQSKAEGCEKRHVKASDMALHHEVYTDKGSYYDFPYQIIADYNGKRAFYRLINRQDISKENPSMFISP